ncbi:DUF1564 family protein [Leptospira neocaledonica]|uniref:DUF1564 domain-containing protein n=1 Tax=Leptospira neocaledonica TaxID=2023192 RepID=A0A2M9ZWV2_9LEPT|nr:DUF1564 family protein [Leptospira neocaledonica]PJZ76528.1 hypothetical protein CH365_14225 [Leptospira neocaledonica]
MEKIKHTFHRSFSQNISLEGIIKKKRKVSTLLIPPHLAKYIRRQGINYLLRKLLTSQRKSFYSNKHLNSESAYTKYQNIRGRSKDNRYIKFNFRPRPEDWIQLRTLAISQGVSTCYLFVLLLEEYKSAGFSNAGKVIWRIKTVLHTNFDSRIFFRELKILEYQLVKSDFRVKRKNPHGPKIA